MNKRLLLLVFLLSSGLKGQYSMHIPIHIDNKTNQSVAVSVEKGAFSKARETVPANETKTLILKDENKGKKTSQSALALKCGSNGHACKFIFTQEVPNNPYDSIMLTGKLVKKSNGTHESEIFSKQMALPIGQEKDDYSIKLVLNGTELERSSIDFMVTKTRNGHISSPGELGQRVPPQ